MAWMASGSDAPSSDSGILTRTRIICKRSDDPSGSHLLLSKNVSRTHTKTPVYVSCHRRSVKFWGVSSQQSLGHSTSALSPTASPQGLVCSYQDWAFLFEFVGLLFILFLGHTQGAQVTPGSSFWNRSWQAQGALRDAGDRNWVGGVQGTCPPSCAHALSPGCLFYPHPSPPLLPVCLL